MILVTVGHQMPFDRLVGAVDDWAAARGRTDVFAQIGQTALRPRQLEWVPDLAPADFARRIQEARVVVAHAGMGTILTALQLGKPLLVMPRRGDLRETRNDHQIATARRFAERGMVHAVYDADDLPAALDRMEELDAAPPISAVASSELLEAIRAFVADAPGP